MLGYKTTKPTRGSYTVRDIDIIKSDRRAARKRVRRKKSLRDHRA